MAGTIGTDLGLFTDAAALKRYASKRDPRAFEALVERYQQMVYATCLRTLGNASDAEDAAQETFLKLARHCGRIKSSVAGWLHASAMTTSIDMIRHERVVDRAEAAAARPSASSAEPGFKELERELDTALAALDPDDRDLLVARFLVGRTEADMAKEARVHAGTMNRRINKALDRLRKKIGSSAFQVMGTAALGAAMVQVGGCAAAPAALGAALNKIGLSGVGSKPATLSIGGAGLAAGALAIVLAGVSAVWIWTQLPAAPGGAPALLVGAPIERPTRGADRYTLVSDETPGGPRSSMVVDGDIMTLWESNSERTLTEIFKIRILSVNLGDPQSSMQVQVESSTLGDWTPLGSMVGREMQVLYELSGDRFRMIPVIDGDQVPSQAWFGVPMPSPRSIPEVNPKSLDPRLQGAWSQVPGWDLEISRDNITMLSGDFEINRFRVLSWDDDESPTRIQSICADSVDQRLIGDRVKLILRRTDDGSIQLAMHASGSGKENEWPTTFEVSDSVRLMTWRKDPW